MNFPSSKFAQSGALTTESPLRDLEAIIRSRMPLIAVESNEEPQVVAMVRQISHRLQLKAFRWTVTEGLQAFDPMDQPSRSVLKSQELLNYIKTDAADSLFVLLDFHPYLKDDMVAIALGGLTMASNIEIVFSAASSARQSQKNRHQGREFQLVVWVFFFMSGPTQWHHPSRASRPCGHQLRWR